jgi:small subunit ribosomal protein S16
MVKIRLKKTGAKNWISFRIVVTDIRTARDGKVIEEVGYYDPRHSDEKIDVAVVESWIAKGAVMSETVESIFRRAKEGKSKVKGVADAFKKKKVFKKGAAGAEGAAKEEAKA